MDSRVYIDTNVLLDILLDRDQSETARKLVSKYEGRSYISSLTGHLVVYFCTGLIALDVLDEFLSDHIMLSLDKSDFDWAFLNCKDNDFEDALQLATAIRHGCDKFITFDKKLVKTYSGMPTISVELASQ